MLEIQKYLNKGNTLEDLNRDFHIETKVRNGKVSFNYSQALSPMGERICQECRGLILREDTWEILACPFFKFFNYSEELCAEIDWKSAKVLEKIDGCLDENAEILTENGLVKIKDLIEMENKPNIYSYNIVSNEIELDEIVGKSIKKNIDNWYELTLEDGTCVKLTGNHLVYLPQLNCYRKIEDLNGDEYILLEKVD